MLTLNRIKNIILSLTLCVLFPAMVSAQDNNSSEVAISMSIPAISLLNFVVEGSHIITYTHSYVENKQVQQVITPTTGKTWLNYTSIVNEGLTNYITAHISEGTLPGDVTLDVYISSYVGNGAGAFGTSLGRINLTSYPKNIIVNIGSCYTGVGLKKGHELTYAWENPDAYDYELKYENGQAISVTYTISSTE